MNETPLIKYVEKVPQPLVAKALGCTTGAIWQALQLARDVYIVTNDDGSISGAYEKKPFPGRKAHSMAQQPEVAV
ncbi:hypothetical protein DRQ53_08020 [bacterium]|nr:MAG: hypothetical protein DRQ53_08020 [bacterium]